MRITGKKVLINDEVALVLSSTAPGDIYHGWSHSDFYHICLPKKHWLTGYEVIGRCDLRFGFNRQLYYGGNIGYRIWESYRGHHMAEKATRLLLEEAKKAGFTYVIITCNPDNLASKKTLINAGGYYVETVPLPEDNDMYQRGDREKDIFYFPLTENTLRSAEEGTFLVAADSYGDFGNRIGLQPVRKWKDKTE